MYMVGWAATCRWAGMAGIAGIAAVFVFVCVCVSYAACVYVCMSVRSVCYAMICYVMPLLFVAKRAYVLYCMLCWTTGGEGHGIMQVCVLRFCLSFSLHVQLC